MINLLTSQLTAPYMAIIRKYAQEKADTDKFNWEQLGRDVYDLIKERQTQYDPYGNPKDRQLHKREMELGESVLDFFFSESSFGAPIYNWVNGNQDWKILVNSFKK